MTSQWEGGKGSKPRPIENRKKFEDNWDKIFGKKNDERLVFKFDKDGKTIYSVDTGDLSKEEVTEFIHK